MSLANTAYFANGFAVGGMMSTDDPRHKTIPMVWEDDPKDRAPFTEAIDTIKELRRRNAELEAALATKQAIVKNAIDMFFKEQAERDRLKAELDSIFESYRNVLAEPCESDDRVHCTCVPSLRAENARLRNALLNIQGAYENPCLTDIYDLYVIAKAALKEVDGGKG